MFKYFPTNYVWNLSVDLSIEMGARIGEIEAMCAPLIEASKAPDAAGTKAFRETWVKMADKLCELAAEDEAKGRMLSAGEKFRRASSYLITAERMQAHDAPGRMQIYQRELDLFLKGSRLMGDKLRRVEIPYEGKHLAALYYPAEGLKPGERAPILVQLNGLDSTKEMKYLVGLPAWLAKRGVSSLVVDQPGTGEALRLQKLQRALRHRTLGQPGRRLAGTTTRGRCQAHRLRRRLTRRLLLPALGRDGTALCGRRVLGCESRLA